VFYSNVFVYGVYRKSQNERFPSLLLQAAETTAIVLLLIGAIKAIVMVAVI